MHDKAMSDESLLMAELDRRVTGALEAAPEVTIPADFAKRVSARVPVRRVVALSPTSYGRTMMAVSAVVLLVAILTLAPRAVGSSAVWLTVEWLLCAQFLGLVVWFGARLRDSR